MDMGFEARKWLCLAALGSSVCVFGNVAGAADQLGEPPTVTRSWTGCYAGVNVGYVKGHDDAVDAPFTEGPFAGTGVSWNSPPGAYEAIGSDPNGAIGGLEAGCDYEMPLGGVSLVIGGAADISALGL